MPPLSIAYIDNRLNDRRYIYYGAYFRGLKAIGAQVNNLRGYDFGALKKYNLIIFGLGFFDGNVGAHGKLQEIDSLNCPKIAILHKIKNDYQAKLNFCQLNGINKIFTTTPFCKQIAKDSGIPTHTLPYCADKELFRPIENVEKKYDIGFSGALHAGKKRGCEKELENIRVKIKTLLDARTDLQIFWNGTDSIRTRIDNQEDYVHKINECKLWLCITGPSHDVNPRFHEVPLCGVIPFINTIPASYYDEFYQDSHNCMSFKNDLSNFNSQLDKGLNNYKSLAAQAYEFALQKCTLESRATQLMGAITQK